MNMGTAQKGNDMGSNTKSKGGTLTTTEPKEVQIEIPAIVQSRIKVCILGTTPLILNRLSEKAKHELLLPAPKKNAAAKASTLKHDPRAEYVASAYKFSSETEAPTEIYFSGLGFKAALCGAAVDIPGAAKAQCMRLIYISQEKVPIYGIPKQFMAVTRCSDMNRTPDVRTRCIIPEWACEIEVRFIRQFFREQAVLNLLAAAGIMRGLGDCRPHQATTSRWPASRVQGDPAPAGGGSGEAD